MTYKQNNVIEMPLAPFPESITTESTRQATRIVDTYAELTAKLKEIENVPDTQRVNLLEMALAIQELSISSKNKKGE